MTVFSLSFLLKTSLTSAPRHHSFPLKLFSLSFFRRVHRCLDTRTSATRGDDDPLFLFTLLFHWNFFTFPIFTIQKDLRSLKLPLFLNLRCRNTTTKTKTKTKNKRQNRKRKMKYARTRSERAVCVMRASYWSKVLAMRWKSLASFTAEKGRIYSVTYRLSTLLFKVFEDPEISKILKIKWSLRKLLLLQWRSRQKLNILSVGSVDFWKKGCLCPCNIAAFPSCSIAIIF